MLPRRVVATRYLYPIDPMTVPYHLARRLFRIPSFIYHYDLSLRKTKLPDPPLLSISPVRVPVFNSKVNSYSLNSHSCNTEYLSTSLLLLRWWSSSFDLHLCCLVAGVLSSEIDPAGLQGAEERTQATKDRCGDATVSSSREGQNRPRIE